MDGRRAKRDRLVIRTAVADHGALATPKALAAFITAACLRQQHQAPVYRPRLERWFGKDTIAKLVDLGALLPVEGEAKLVDVAERLDGTPLVRFATEASPRRRNIPLGQRWEVLRRDGFRCVYCVATGQETRLHVDHVHPVAAGGLNDHSNLVTACEECNLGKSDSVEAGR